MDLTLHRVKHPHVKLKKPFSVQIDYQGASYRAFTVTEPKIFGVAPTVSGAIKALENRLPALYLLLLEQRDLNEKSRRILAVLTDHFERVVV